ncbi:MAG: alpha/beta fold hydrolase, partial [Bradyrhizobium sp.]|nr:alpha/beta fold hydrolase [Bradyrhizobium sp.]
MTSFVLVHGAWHGGWCWRRVSDILTRRGHRVFAPTLTGLADRSHLLSGSVNVDTHVADIVNLIEWEDLGDVVLCGHSYAGLVITGVAEQIGAKLAALAYLDAFVPKDGDTAQSLSGGTEPVSAVVPPPPVAMLRLANPADIAWVEAKMTAHPGAAMGQALRITGAYRDIPRKAYILANRSF